MEFNEAMKDVCETLDEANLKYGAFCSPHEGLAVILEEYEELKAEVFKNFTVRTQEEMRKEASHIAAMAVRFMTDLT